MEFRGKKFLVLGAGISGVSVAGVLQDLGAKVTISDAKTADKLHRDVSALLSSGITVALGQQDESLLDNMDYVVLSPGVSIYNPLVAAAEKSGITVVSEVEIAYQICRASIIAVTGTNGKTTTTTLIGEILKAGGRKVVVGGNIGIALSQEVRHIQDSGIVVAEISSFQLEAVNDFRPHIAVILNMTPDHLDRHKSFETYRIMKERLFAKQTNSDYTILNYDDPIVRGMAERTQAQVMFFSRTAKLNQGVFVEDGIIKISWKEDIITIGPVKILKLKGVHNLENALAACGACYLAGAHLHDMANVLGNFSGVEHRIELVAEINGVSYYNDSKATNPESSIKALEAFEGNIILIAGGRDKKTDLTAFMRLIKQKVDHLILLGEAKQRFLAAAVAENIKNIHQTESFEEAVRLARQLAKAPQIVLLSPACASYDMFNNYEERGKVFKQLVHQLS